MNVGRAPALEERPQGGGCARRRERAQRRNGEVELVHAERALVGEPREEPAAVRVEARAVDLGDEADKRQRLVEADDAQLARGRLGDDEVLALDRAAEDRARVAFGRQTVLRFRGRKGGLAAKSLEASNLDGR